jgi:hypothetical protein
MPSFCSLLSLLLLCSVQTVEASLQGITATTHAVQRNWHWYC